MDTYLETYVVHALSLKVELPEGIPVFRSIMSVRSHSKLLARKKRGTIGWVKTTGEPAPCHRRHNRWYTNDDTLAQLVIPQKPVLERACAY